MRRSVMLLVSVGSAVLLACGAAWAAAGDLDPTFGGDGTVVSTEPCFVCLAEHLEVLPGSGKILAAGEYGGPVVRYNPDGSLDDTFGGDGLASTGPVALQAFAVQPDGGIIVGGVIRNAQDPDPEFAVARLLPDGTLDPAFGGGDGVVAVGFGERTTEEVNALAMQGANIVAVGRAYSRGTSGIALARFLPDGTLDPAFGEGDGKTIKGVGGWPDVRDLAVLPDNRLMVAGGASFYSGSDSENDIFLTRFMPDGASDGRFGGGDGQVRTGYAKGTYEFATSLTVKGDRAVVAGATYAAAKDSPARFVLFAYADDGKLAKSFGGGDGKLKTVFGVGDAVARDLVFTQGDGKLLVVGEQNKFLKGHRGISFALSRYKTDGTLDKSFGGGDGKLTTDVSPGTEDYAAAVDIDEDGRAVVGGAAVAYNSTNGQYNNVFGLARYLLE